MAEGRPKRAKLPFEPSHLSYLCTDDDQSLKLLTKLADQAPDNFEHSKEDDEILAEGLEAMLSKSREQLAQLQERSRVLNDLVKSEFEIYDADKWLAEQSESRNKDSKPITLTIPTEVKGGGKASSAAPTTLRIKLVDPKQAGGKNTSGGTALPAVGRGAGSKNLSRMNRPQDEASKAKAATQIPINVFWNQVEAYFKPIEDGDMKFLCDPSRIIDPSPLIVPPLGKPFQEQWQQQYGYVSNAGAKSSISWSHAGDQYKPTLKERLLSLLVDEGLPESQPMDIDGPAEDNETSAVHEDSSFEQVPTISAGYIHLDQRLRQELAASGFEEFANCSVDYQEDDVICTELRSLQRQLQEQVAVNYYRKRKLSDIAKTRLEAQEFYSLLSDLDKQLEQVYLKRSKSGKKKKKGSSSASSVGDTAVAVPPETVRLLENRAKLLSAFALYIPRRCDFLASTESPLICPEEEQHVIEIAKQTGNWLPLPGAVESIPTEFSRPMPQTQPVFPK